MESTHLVLKCDKFGKSVPYHSESNLPTLFTMLGVKIAHAYIANHILLNKAYFEK